MWMNEIRKNHCGNCRNWVDDALPHRGSAELI